MKRIFLVAALLTGAIGSTQAANNLVVNGSFELGSFGIGSFQGWQTALGDATTFVDSSGQTGPLYGQASDGLWSAYFGTLQAAGGATISQALATVAGQAYELSFDLASDNAGAAPLNEFVASIDGAKVYDGVNLADQAYVHERVSFVATGSATTLTLGGYNDASYLELDAVSVTAVPEPATAWLAAIGSLALGLARRVRRTR